MAGLIGSKHTALMTSREKYELLIGERPWERRRSPRMTFAAAGGDKSSERLARLRILWRVPHAYNKVKEKVGEATRSFFSLFFISKEN